MTTANPRSGAVYFCSSYELDDHPDYWKLGCIALVYHQNQSMVSRSFLICQLIVHVLVYCSSVVHVLMRKILWLTTRKEMCEFAHTVFIIMS